MQPLSIACSYDLLAYAGSRYYAYIESYDASGSSIALLNINVTSLDADCFCVQLHYHMLGAGIGALTVLSVKPTGGFTIEWGEGGGTYVRTSEEQVLSDEISNMPIELAYNTLLDNNTIIYE